MIKQDYYDILGLKSGASPREIRTAHRALVRRYHPDTAPDGVGSAERFALVQEAYEVLIQEDRRKNYDAAVKAANEPKERPHRHPPKLPCDVCKNLVYASQRHLHLGRYMCAACYEKRQQRRGKIVDLLSLTELRWRIRQLRASAQSHAGLIIIAIAAMAIAGGRVWQMHRHDQRHPHNTQVKAPAPPALPRYEVTPFAIPRNPCDVRPAPAPEP